MDRDHRRANDESRLRLAALATRLGEDELSHDLGGGWTVSATLAHVAFWDRACLVRWERFGDEGALEEFPDPLIDVVNAAGLPFWRALPPAEAIELALAAATEVDARVAALPEEAVTAAVRTDRRFLVDRAGHRHAHLDEIERALAAR